MGAPDPMNDLDFTSLAVLPAVKRESIILPETEIGAGVAGGNFVFYTRGAARPAPASPDSPVLVVEDDADTRRLLERVVKLERLPVRTASDSREFAQLIRTPPLPRLVLLDLELPRVNGFKILSLIRQQPQTSAIPVVMVTGHTDNKHILQAMALGADGYLSKPVTVATLRAALVRLLPGAR